MTELFTDPVTGPAALATGLDPQGATLSTTSSLVATIAELRLAHTDAQRALVLLSAALSNASEIADVHGSGALELVTAELAWRTLQHPTLQVKVLRASPLGGFLLAVVVDRDAAREQVEEVLTDVRRLVGLPDDRVWPVVTVGASECPVEDEIWAVLSDVRAAVVAAGRESPGATRWRASAMPADAADELTQVRDLAVAIATDPEQLQLHFQPLYDLRGQRVVGAEALLRWTHPDRGPVSPIHTIEAAERTGLIVPLGRLVLEKALAQLVAWGDQVPPDFRLHVNVSALELRVPSYVGFVESTLADAGVPPSMLLLEITETAILADEIVVHDTLMALRGLGVSLGIDDFGTGYSSIAHLHRLPVDIVKVDRSLISGVANDSSDYLLTRAVLSLVSTLGVTIVAEGIENAMEAAHLRSMGCTLGQGYHLGRPVPAADFLALGTVHPATA